MCMCASDFYFTIPPFLLINAFDTYLDNMEKYNTEAYSEFKQLWRVLLIYTYCSNIYLFLLNRQYIIY